MYCLRSALRHGVKLNYLIQISRGGSWQRRVLVVVLAQQAAHAGPSADSRAPMKQVAGKYIPLAPTSHAPIPWQRHKSRRSKHFRRSRPPQSMLVQGRAGPTGAGRKRNRKPLCSVASGRQAGSKGASDPLPTPRPKREEKTSHREIKSNK